MDILNALGKVNFTNCALFPIIKNVQRSKIGYVPNAVNLPTLFFSIKFLNAHLQYVYSIKDTPKALGCVDFTKCAPLPIIQYVQWSKIGYVQNAVNL